MQKSYLTKMFDLGEQTGHKTGGATVSESMRRVRSLDGSFLFDTSEYLTAKQIKSFFSRLAKKRREIVSSSEESDEDDEDDELARLYEEECLELAQKVRKEVALVHPIMFESHNICTLTSSAKLTKFSISMLKDICCFFDLDTSSFKGTRKQQYIDKLAGLVRNCSCQR